MSAIPRKRKTYTSKRLQKVVTDYREEQRKRSRKATKRGSSILLDSDRSEDQYVDTDEDLPTDFGEDYGSDGHGGRDPRSGSVTGTGKMSKPTTATKTMAPAKRKTAGEKRKTRGSSRIASTAPRPAKRKKRANDSDDYDGDEHADSDVAASAPARPKPVRKKANTSLDAGFKIVDQERSGQST